MYDLSDVSAPVILEIDGKNLGVAAAVPAHQWSAQEVAVKNATPARRRNAVKAAIPLAPV